MGESNYLVLFHSQSKPEVIKKQLLNLGFKVDVAIDPNPCDEGHAYYCEWETEGAKPEPTLEELDKLVRNVLPFTTDKRIFLHLWSNEFIGAPDSFEKKLSVADAVELLKAEDGHPRYQDLKVELKIS